MTNQTATARLAYCQKTLADPALSEYRRTLIEAKMTGYRQYVESHCADCGRSLTAPESVARGRGSVCAHG